MLVMCIQKVLLTCLNLPSGLVLDRNYLVKTLRYINNLIFLKSKLIRFHNYNLVYNLIIFGLFFKVFDVRSINNLNWSQAFWERII